MPDLTDTTIAWERAMSQFGEENYFRNAVKAKSEGKFTLVASGRALLRESLQDTHDEIVKWLAWARPLTVGQDIEAYPWLLEIDPMQASLVANTVIVDHLHRWMTVRALASAVGRSLEDHARFTAIRRRHPSFWREVKESTKHSGPTHRRRTAMAKSLHLDWLPASWPLHARNRVGLVCLRAFERATGMLAFENKKVANKRVTLLVGPTDETLEWIEAADDRASFLGPLYLPTLEPPADWESAYGGGYLTDLVLRRPLTRQTSGRAKKLFNLIDPSTYGEPLSAINRLQSVAWTINEDILETLEHIAENHGLPLPDLVEEDIPQRPEDVLNLDGESYTDEYKAWRQRIGMIKDNNRSRKSRRVLVDRTVRVGRMLNEQERFYFPHRHCFRGRVYPTPYWVQPQAGDMSRSLLRFEESAPLTKDGEQAMLNYGANLWGSGPTSPAFLYEIAQEATADPIANKVWHDADEPFQFLAWCLEMDGCLNGENTRIPVHLDAKNNGLQLFALMTNDRELAELTGAIGDGRQDIYVAVGDTSGQVIALDADLGHPLAADLQGLLGEEGIPRVCAKRPVMTLAYGVTEWSAQNYVRDWYNDTFGRLSGPLGPRPGPACRYLSESLLTATRKKCKGAMAAMEWLQEVALLYLAEGITIQWVSPSGWPVFQDYREHETRRVQTALGGSMRNLKFRYGTGPPSKAQSLQGIAPNFVHSVDAAVKDYVVSRWTHGPITAVHDSFGVLAPHVPALHKLLREAVAHVVLEENPLKKFWADSQARLRADVPRPPLFRSCYIEPDEVLQAKGLFS